MAIEAIKKVTETEQDSQKRRDAAVAAGKQQVAEAQKTARRMLEEQRQQAEAVIEARQKIVEGAVSMVEMALEKLSADKVVEMDDRQKAQLVSNLLVVLCGDDNAQPVVNTGAAN